MLEQATAITITGPLVFGLLLALLNSLRAALAKQSALAENQLAGLLGTMNTALIPMMLFAGVLTDQFGPKTLFLCGSLLAATGVFLFSACTTYAQTLATILLTGAGAACLSVGSTVLMDKGFFPDNMAASQNMGNLFFGVGVMVTPLLANGLLSRITFRRAMVIMALICLVPAVAAMLTSHQALELPNQEPNLSAVMASPVLWLSGIIFLLYLPVEWTLGMSHTGSLYLRDCGLREVGMARLQAVYWLLFLGSRLGMGVLQNYGLMPHRTGQIWLILSLGLATAVFLGNMVNARSASSGIFGYLLVGVFLGPIFPTLVGVLLDYFPKSMGTAYGAMFSLGSLGNLFLMPAIRLFGTRTNPHKAIALPMVLAIAMSAVALLFGLGWPR